MDKFVVTLGPVFAAGFAVQQLLEVLQLLLGKLESCPGKSLLYRFVKKEWVAEFANTIRANKKLILAAVALAMGFALASGAGLRVLNPLGFAGLDFWDVIVTGLVISAGTEGLNSLLKFMGYTKDKKKVEAKEMENKRPILEKLRSEAAAETEETRKQILVELTTLVERA